MYVIVMLVSNKSVAATMENCVMCLASMLHIINTIHVVRRGKNENLLSHQITRYGRQHENVKRVVPTSTFIHDYIHIKLFCVLLLFYCRFSQTNSCMSHLENEGLSLHGYRIKHMTDMTRMINL